MPLHPLPWRERILPALLGWQVLAGACRAEVPMEQALGLYAATPPERRAYSPFWGMVAIKSGILANIRFFGGYASSERTGLPRHRAFLKRPEDNCPQDAIAGVVQYLFPSPDGFNLVANAYTKDPIGQIAREARSFRSAGQRPPAGQGLGRINRLLEAVAIYRRQIDPPPSGAGGLALVPAGASPVQDGKAAEAFRQAVGEVLDPGKAGGPEGSSFNVLRRQFAGLLQRAVREERTGTLDLYPPDTVEVALLAYAWKVADQVEELYQAFRGHLLGPPATKARFDRAYYLEHWPAFRRRLDEADHALENAAGPLSPEELFLFAYSHRAYASPVPDPVPYQETTYKGQTYPDCGETALRNFFNTIFTRGGELDPERIQAFLERVKDQAARAPEGAAGGQGPALPGNLRGLADYYAAFADAGAHYSDAAHARWSDLVSDLNRPGDPIPITYREGSHNVQGTGIGNMLDLIGHLLPDPVLATPWPAAGDAWHRLAEAKLDRLCQLASDKEIGWAWRVGDDPAIPGAFPEVTFTRNGVPAFRWQFLPGHFDVVSVWKNEAAPGWEAKAIRQARDPWLALWLHPDDPRALERHGRHWIAVLKRPYDIYGFRLRSGEAVLAPMEGLVAARRYEQIPTFQLMANRIAFDHYTLNRLAALLRRQQVRRRGDGWYPIHSLLRRPQADKDRMLAGALARPRDDFLVPMLLDHGARAERPVKGWGTLLCQAIAASPGDVPTLLQAGADPNGRDPSGRPALALAVSRYRDADMIRSLIQAGALVDGRLPDGRTPLMDGLLHKVDLPVLRALVEAGADPRAVDKEGRSVLDWAAHNPKGRTWLEQQLRSRPAPGAAAETKAERKVPAGHR